MPELPDVEVFRRVLIRHGLHERIETVSAAGDRVLRVAASTLRAALRGHELLATRRHGKHLFVEIDEERRRWLRLHFGMTGSLVWVPAEEDPPDHLALRLVLDGGSLAYRNVRKLGQVDLVDSPAAFVQEKGLGPDPLLGGFGLPELREALRGRSGALKATLMNQGVLAGLGNVYTDETLFQAGLEPRRAPADLSATELRRLLRSMRSVLAGAMEAAADVERMPRSWLLPHRRPDADCPRCGGTIRKSTISGRSTYACDRHQE